MQQTDKQNESHVYFYFLHTIVIIRTNNNLYKVYLSNALMLCAFSNSFYLSLYLPSEMLAQLADAVVAIP